MANHILDSKEFIQDMKDFEKAVKKVSPRDMIPLQQDVYPWVYHILKDHIDLEKSDEMYVKNIVSILESNNISKPVVRCLTSYWFVELKRKKNNNSYSGYQALRNRILN